MLKIAKKDFKTCYFKFKVELKKALSSSWKKLTEEIKERVPKIHIS